MSDIRAKRPGPSALIGMAVALLVLAGEGAVRGEVLTLDRAVQVALEQSPAARMADRRVALSSAKSSQALAAFFPSLRLVSSYSVTDNPVMAFSSALNQGKFSQSIDVNNPPTTDNWQLSAVVQYRLFAGGRDLASLQAARAAERSSDFMRRSDQSGLTLQVTRAYLGVLTAQELVRSARAAVEDFRAGEKVMASRVAAGTSLRTGLLEIQVQLAQSEARLLEATNGLAVAVESLRFAMGVDSLDSREFSRLDDLDLPVPAPGAGVERPEVLARAAMADAARAEQRAARAGYIPQVNAFASADRFQGREFDGTGESWSAGLSLEWQLFDGLFTPAQVREKRAAVRLAEEGERMARLQASLARKTATLNLQNAGERVTVVERAVSLAREHRALATQRFEQGLLLPSELIDAENALVQAEASLAQAKADRQLAVASLRHALGLPILGDASR